MLSSLKTKFGKVLPGTRIRILYVEDQDGNDWQASKMVNKTGIVEYIDDAGFLHGSWGGLAVLPDVDEFEVLL